MSKKEVNVKEEKESKDMKKIEKKEETEEKNSKKKQTKKEIEKEIDKEKEKDKDKDKASAKKGDEFKPVNQKKVEKNKYKNIEEVKKINKMRKIRIIIIATIFVLILIFSTAFAFFNENNENILSGITIEGIEVSNLSKQEAMDKLNKIYDDKKKAEIDFSYQDYQTAVTPELIETKYNIENAVDEALLIGKNSNIFVNNFEILKTFFFKENINVEMTLNEDVAKQTIEDLGTKLPGLVVESSYYRDENNLVIEKGKGGVKVDSNKMLEMVKEELNNIEINQNYLEIPVYTKQPDTIDVDKIHSEIYTEVQDAYYTKNPFEIHPEVEGVDFNVDNVKQTLAAESKEEYIIPLTITEPKITLAQIGTEAFPDQLATFTTKYDASNTDRSTNLKLACQKLNGKVILAGDTFSYNTTLGERTVAAGYRNGKIYENGEVVDGIGGGICQISSTLYNAVLMANLDIVERRNHQFVTSYLPAGRDATVSYGTTDFKFKNTRKYPVRLVASVSNGIATVSVYGIKEDQEYTISFNTQTISTIPQEVQYIEDSSVPAGTEKVKQQGTNGQVCETYITKTLNGKVVSKKLLSRDTYSAMPKIILTGTGGGTNSTKTEEETTPTTTTPTQTEAPSNTTTTINTNNTTTNTSE